MRITREDGYEIDTDPARVDVEVVWSFLHYDSYWATGVPRAIVEKSLEHSLSFGIYREGSMVGFARLVTDHSTIIWICDVFVLEAHRGHGLGKWLMKTIVEYPDFQHIRRMLLGTRDAHELYKQFGFVTPPHQNYLHIRKQLYPEPNREGR